MQSRNPLLPKAIDEADLAAIAELVAIGRELAATLDWNQVLSSGATASAAG
jgi:hypothetical protein